MDIHKPKAAHSWREFLIEIGTIICGILIALGLEQVLEQVHSSHETELLERALKVEVTRNIGEALQQASMFYCVRAQTAAAVDLLNRAADWPGARPLDPKLPVSEYNGAVFYSPAAGDARTIPQPAKDPGLNNFSPQGGVPHIIPSPRSTMVNQSWLNAASTPALLHMDQRRRDRFGLIYYQMAQLEAAIADTVGARHELAALAFPQRLTSEDRRRYLAYLSRLDGDYRNIYSSTGLFMARAAKNGIRPDPQDQRERLGLLRKTWGACVTPFVMPEHAMAWIEKFENDRMRFEAD